MSTYVVSILTGVALSVGHAHARMPSKQNSPPHQSAAGTPPAALVAACVEAQQQVAGLAAQANRRLEDARQTNNLVQMRAALADLQAALVEIQTRAEQCSPLHAAAQGADPHAASGAPGSMDKRIAPGTPVVQPGSTSSAPAAPDLHAAHTAGETKETSPAKSASTTADPHTGHATATPKPAASSKRATKPADPHAGHAPAKPAAPKPSGSSSTMRPAAKQTLDPVCGKTVDPATAPNTTYNGVTYHFCSAEDRLRFIRNPETYLKNKAKR